MSSKLLKKLLQQASDFDTVSDKTDADKAKKSKEAASKKKADKRTLSLGKESSEEVEEDPIQKQIKSMIQFDRTIARYSRYEDSVMKKRQREEQREAKSRKKLQSLADGGVGNSRSSSSRNALLGSEPTLTKNKIVQEKEAKNLRDIAKMLQKRKKSRQSR
mmetsp:Transcript_22532/g.33532  ORF Transcript_22532/g.33532 Transcript_22532/m.33532 type:complete len:161 (-) Transcript_22532:2632-3114(-)